MVLLLLVTAAVFGGRWLHDHPQHNPWAPLQIDHPPGWATVGKLARLRDDPQECRAVLVRSAVAFDDLPPRGSGTCRREDRVTLASSPAIAVRLTPPPADSTCAVAAGLAIWLRHDVQPAAERLLGQPVRAVEHYGTASCRRIGGGTTGRWSEHATGNAIDIGAFVLGDGRRVSVLGGWQGTSNEALFLHTVRDRACKVFGTVLSPDYNAAHADHLHLDQAGRGRGWSFCR